MVESTSDTQVQLIPNPYFCAEKGPSFQKVTYNLEIEFDDGMSLFLDDQLDVATQLTKRHVDTFLQDPFLKDKITVLRPGAGALYVMVLNSGSPIMQDDEIRTAIGNALRTIARKDNLDIGMNFVAVEGFVPEAYRAQSPEPTRNTPQTQADVIAEVSQVLQTKGYSAEKPLHLFLTSFPVEEVRSWLLIAESVLGAIPEVEVEIDQEMDIDTFLSFGLMPDREDVDMHLYYWKADFPDMSAWLEFPMAWKLVFPENNARLTDEFQEANQSLDPEARKTQLAAFERSLLAEGSVIPFGRSQEPIFARSSLAFRGGEFTSAKQFYSDACKGPRVTDGIE